MSELLNISSAVLNDIGRWFCNYSTDIFIQSGILIILLLIIEFLLRKRMRATFGYWIWMLVLLKLMLPPAFSLPTGIGHWFGDCMPAQTSISKQVSNMVWFKPAGASAPQDPSFSGENPQVHLSQASPEPAAPALPVISDFHALKWQAGSYKPSFWDKLSYEIGIEKRRSMGSSYGVGLDTQSFSFDDGPTIILTKEGKVNKAEPHSLGGSSLISTIQKPKPMIQHTFRLRSIKQKDLKRIPLNTGVIRVSLLKMLLLNIM